MQSKRHSAVEAVANTTVGYGVAVMIQVVILPQFGVSLPLSDNLKIGLWFTAISIVRSYALRRAFNRWHLRTHVR